MDKTTKENEGKWDKKDLWKEKGYRIWQPYKEGYAIKTNDPNWNFTDRKGSNVKLESPQEFKHTLSAVLNGLSDRGFRLIKFDEHTGTDYNSEPGTWEHYISVAPPWFFLWLVKEK